MSQRGSKNTATTMALTLLDNTFAPSWRVVPFEELPGADRVPPRASGHVPVHRAAFDRGRSYPSLAGHAGERGERAMTGRYRFTHVWILVLVGVGLAILSIGVLSAALLLLVPTEIPVPAPWPRLLARPPRSSEGSSSRRP
jgi:hypothetical protein